MCALSLPHQTETTGEAHTGFLGVFKRGDKFYSNVYNPVDGQLYPACMMGVATAEEAAQMHDAKVEELGMPPTELNFPPPGVVRRELPAIPVRLAAPVAKPGGGGGGGVKKKVKEETAADADGDTAKKPRGRPPGSSKSHHKKPAANLLADGPPPGFGWELGQDDAQQPAARAEPPPPQQQQLEVYTSIEAFLRHIQPPLRDCDATVVAAVRSGYTTAHFQVVHGTLLNDSLPTSVRQDIMARLCAALELGVAADQTALHVAFTKASFQEPQGGEGTPGGEAGGDAMS